jgi:hypothetical protein
MWRILKMQAAYSGLVACEGVVDLHDGFIEACRTEFIDAVKARQKTTMVFYGFALHQRQSCQRGRNKIKAGHN